jgi:hypothetical protein
MRAKSARVLIKRSRGVLERLNRSQSAVSEPTPLSVPFEAMSSALNTNNAGMPICRCL